MLTDVLLCQRVEHQVGNRYSKSGADTVDRVFGWERQIVLNVVESGYGDVASGWECTILSKFSPLILLLIDIVL